MFEILNVVIPFIVGLCILSVPIFVIGSGVLFLIASEKDVLPEKAKWKKRAWWTLATPLVIVCFLVIFWGLAKIIHSL